MIFIILLICLIVMSVKSQPSEAELKYTNDKFISLRAVLAVMVVFGHTWSDNTYNNVIIDHVAAPFNNTGYLDVAMFFFLSGFGTYESAKKKKDYFEHFFRKKLIKIFIPYWLINFIYIFMALITEQQINIIKMLLSFIWPIYNTSAWYVFAVALMYVIMYALMSKMYSKKRLYIILAGCILVYTIIAYLLKLGSWWYVSTFAVPVGVIFSDYKEKFVQKFPTVICGCLFLILYVFMVWNKSILPSLVIIAIKMLTAVLIPMTVCGIMKYRRIESKIFSYIGKCSYEIYLMQGLFVLYFKITYENIIISSELTSLFSVLFAVFSGCIIHTIVASFNKKLT